MVTPRGNLACGFAYPSFSQPPLHGKYLTRSSLPYFNFPSLQSNLTHTNSPSKHATQKSSHETPILSHRHRLGRRLLRIHLPRRTQKKSSRQEDHHIHHNTHPSEKGNRDKKSHSSQNIQRCHQSTRNRSQIPRRQSAKNVTEQSNHHYRYICRYGFQTLESCKCIGEDG